MKSAVLLIDMARDKVHSDAAVAREIGVHRQTIHEVRKGKRHLTDEQVAGLCNLLNLSGDEAREWLAVVAVGRAQENSRADLRRAFFVAWIAGVVAIPAGLAPSDATAGTAAQPCTEHRTAFDKTLFARALSGPFTHCRALVTLLAAALGRRLRARLPGRSAFRAGTTRRHATA